MTNKNKFKFDGSDINEIMKCLGLFTKRCTQEQQDEIISFLQSNNLPVNLNFHYIKKVVNDGSNPNRYLTFLFDKKEGKLVVHYKTIFYRQILKALQKDELRLEKILIYKPKLNTVDGDYDDDED